MDKTIHDVFKLGSRADFNGRPFQLDEIMVCGTTELLYTVCRFVDKSGRYVLCSIDIETNVILPLAAEQRDFYNKISHEHNKRLFKGSNQNVISYKEKCDRVEYKDIVRKIGIQENIKHLQSQIYINDKVCDIIWYSFLCNKSGDALIVSVSQAEMFAWLSKQVLYDELELVISFSEYEVKYRGNVVRIEYINEEYFLYIHPYPIEIMQSTKCKSTSFDNIQNPFTVMDFIINHADSDVKGIIYPNCERKIIHNYIVVGLLKNLEVEIEECVIGNVRIGNDIDTSEKFQEMVSGLGEEHITYIWVNVKADSLYNAFSLGKKMLVVAVEFLSFMTKNDMYTDWFGLGELNNSSWDVRNHYPQIGLSPVFYIENCILGESITLTDENLKVPSVLKLDNNADYLFEYEWIEAFFRKLKAEDKKILRLQYALKWLVEAWNTDDKYDRVIYCSMALEFIVNGEKGHNIFDEYAIKAGRKVFTKKERKAIINSIIEKINVTDVDGLTHDDVDNLNGSLKKMINAKLSDTSFGTKLENLIIRLDIPVSSEERELLNKARTIRNELIHGINMASISTLQIKKLCGVSSRILMYKLMDELGKSEM